MIARAGTGPLRRLVVLRHAKSAWPEGVAARFETYAYADRLLGLDLTRDLGSPA